MRNDAGRIRPAGVFAVWNGATGQFADDVEREGVMRALTFRKH
jgi:hypothetical protein